MILRNILFISCILLVLSFDSSTSEDKIKGITLVSAPEPIEDKAFDAIKNIKANWVVVNPFAFSSSESSTRINYDGPRQWWGERPEGIRLSTKKAHEAGFKVMLKPQVWIPGGWVGYVKFDDVERRALWRKNYRAYMTQMATMAEEMQVELLCIGTEFDQTVMHDLVFWKNLIKEIRTIYKGKLTYAANWTHYDELEIWEDLDYIGIDAYFPLIDEKTPSVETIKSCWSEKKGAMKNLVDKYDKPIIFTEFGYLSVNGCAFEHWKLEEKREQVRTNEQAQANAIQGLLESFMHETWWHGCFLWKWYPTKKANTGEGSWSKDYTPQGKQSEKVLQECFSKF